LGRAIEKRTFACQIKEVREDDDDRSAGEGEARRDFAGGGMDQINLATDEKSDEHR
jgi:hypothetical protein